MQLAVLLLAGGLATPAEPPHLAGPRLLNSRTVVLSYGADDESAGAEVELYLSRDGGAQWTLHACERNGPRSVRCVLPADGTFGCYLVLRNEAGVSGPPPAPGTAPLVELTIDTAAPLVQIHGVGPHPEQTGAAARLRVSVVEAGERPRDARMFFRAVGETAWRDGGGVQLAGMNALWALPPNLPERVDLYLCVVDAAGNRGGDVETNVPSSALRGDAAAQASPDTARLVADVAPDNPQAARAADATRDTAPDHAAAAKPAPPPGEVAEVRRLLGRALEALEDGRDVQAASLLRQALRAVPNEPHVQTDLANMLVRLRDFDQAQTLFSAALEQAPEHAGALEGLALVATQRDRYHDAEEYLSKLLELQPEVGRHWLHFGNVKHRLGRFAQAREAWQRARETGDDPKTRAYAQRRLEWLTDPADKAVE